MDLVRGADYFSMQVVMLALMTMRCGHLHKVLEGYIVLVVVACLLAGCLVNEGAKYSSARQAIAPARYDEGALATNHKAATGGRGYLNTNRWNSFFFRVTAFFGLSENYTPISSRLRTVLTKKAASSSRGGDKKYHPRLPMDCTKPKSTIRSGLRAILSAVLLYVVLSL